MTGRKPRTRAQIDGARVTAYRRLAAKAWRNGEGAQATIYDRTADRLQRESLARQEAARRRRESEKRDRAEGARRRAAREAARAEGGVE